MTLLAMYQILIDDRAAGCWSYRIAACGEEGGQDYFSVNDAITLKRGGFVDPPTCPTCCQLLDVSWRGWKIGQES